MGRACDHRNGGTVHGLVNCMQAYFRLVLFSPFNTSNLFRHVFNSPRHECVVLNHNRRIKGKNRPVPNSHTDDGNGTGEKKTVRIFPCTCSKCVQCAIKM